jgi:hypothetical protein
VPPPGFQAFTIKANGRLNRIITEVVVMPAFDPTSPPSSLPPQAATKALWDTGATRSALAPSLVAKLNLVSVGSAKLSHAGGQTATSTYMVNLGLPNRVLVAGMLVTEFQSPTSGFEAIVGMDVIGHGDLALTHVNGNTQMSFRIPSRTAVDYVAEHSKTLFAGVGRNDPCPCGTLKPDGRVAKFKQCHGA